MGRTPGPAPSREPGASDNRLSLDVSQFDFLQQWEDGNEYTMTVKVSQVSPGEFEVMSATEAPEADETPEEPAAQEEPDMPMKGAGAGYKNPAIASLMAGEKS